MIRACERRRPTKRITCHKQHVSNKYARNLTWNTPDILIVKTNVFEKRIELYKI